MNDALLGRNKHRNRKIVTFPRDASLCVLALYVCFLSSGSTNNKHKKKKKKRGGIDCDCNDLFKNDDEIVDLPADVVIVVGHTGVGCQ